MKNYLILFLVFAFTDLVAQVKVNSQHEYDSYMKNIPFKFPKGDSLYMSMDGVVETETAYHIAVYNIVNVYKNDSTVCAYIDKYSKNYFTVDAVSYTINYKLYYSIYETALNYNIDPFLLLLYNKKNIFEYRTYLKVKIPSDRIHNPYNWESNEFEYYQSNINLYTHE